MLSRWVTAMFATSNRYGVKGFSSRFRAYKSVNQLVPQAVLTIISFDTKVFDSLNEYANIAPNYDFIPRHAGYYLLVYQYSWSVGGALVAIQSYIHVNGVAVALNTFATNEATQVEQTASFILPLNAGDSVNLHVWHNQVGGLWSIASSLRTWFSGHRLS